MKTRLWILVALVCVLASTTLAENDTPDLSGYTADELRVITSRLYQRIAELERTIERLEKAEPDSPDRPEPPADNGAVADHPYVLRVRKDVAKRRSDKQAIVDDVERELNAAQRGRVNRNLTSAVDRSGPQSAVLSRWDKAHWWTASPDEPIRYEFRASRDRAEAIGDLRRLRDEAQQREITPRPALLELTIGSVGVLHDEFRVETVIDGQQALVRELPPKTRRVAPAPLPSVGPAADASGGRFLTGVAEATSAQDRAIAAEEQRQIAASRVSRDGVTIWLSGVAMNGRVDDGPIPLSGRLYEVTGTKTYDTISGGTRTVFVVEPFDEGVLPAEYRIADE